MSLTTCQEKGLEAFMAFLSSNDTFFSLMGVSGAGKTHLSIRYLEALNTYNSARHTLGLAPLETAITATTKKAVGVLNTVLDNYFSTKYGVTTIHSYLGLTMRINYNTGEEFLAKTRRYELKPDTIIFVDEASYINKQLYGYIKGAVSTGTKVVFIGDDDQLLPVNETFSPAFKHTVSKVKLHTTKRQPSGSKITELAHAFRKTLYGDPWPNVADYIGSDVELLDDVDFLNTINTNFLDDCRNNKVICYTNDCVKDYNSHIRALLGRPVNQFLSGETIYLADPILDHSNDTIIIHSDTPVMITPVSAPLSRTVSSSPVQGSMYRVSTPYPNSKSATVIHPDSFDDYKKAIKKLADDKQWKEFYGLKNKVADIRLPYAITAHKSQGSTYSNVFIDLDNLSTCRNKDTLARLLYVAVSRATTKVYLYGSLH